MFKSGNSMAPRLPKVLGSAEDIQLRLVHEATATVRIEPVEPPCRLFDMDKVWGSTIDPDRTFAERALPWPDDDGKGG